MDKKIVGIIVAVIVIIAVIGINTNKPKKQPKMTREQQIEMRNQRIEKALQETEPSARRIDAKIQTKDYKGAVEDCNALQSTPVRNKNPMLLTTCGKAKAQAGDINGAVQDFDKALEIRPDFKMAQYEKERALKMQYRR